MSKELNPEQRTLCADRGALISELKSYGARFSGQSNSCTCIFHDDKHPSASIKQGTDGNWRLRCFVCKGIWSIFDIRAAKSGRTLGDVLKEVGERKAEAPKRAVETPKPVELIVETSKPTVYQSLEKIIDHFRDVEAVYEYTNPDTRVVELAVIRYRQGNKKAFAQCSPVEDGWVQRRPKAKLPLYNRSRVKEAKTVIVVEGEKVVHALTEAGHAATTSPMGAGKAGEADWTPLRGKTVYLWPDNDPIDEKTKRQLGVDHMRDVQRILEPLDCVLYWIEPGDLELEPKGDAYDFIALLKDGKKEDKRLSVQMVLDDAQPLGAARGLEERIRLITSGQWVNIKWPWPYLTEQAQALLPGTVTALCGEPGGAKSFLLLEAFMHWHIMGEEVALFTLEDDRTYHLQRVLAQLENNANLTDADWVLNHPTEATESFNRQRDLLNSFGRVLCDAPDKQMTLTDVADWFETQCEQGIKIVGIDPVTAAEASEKPWIDDQKFIFRVKALAKRYGTRLIYTIHPRIAQGGAVLSRMAGGAAYSRFSHSVLWLTRHDGPVTTVVWGRQEGQRNVTYERALKIAKARNGKGAGGELAFHLNAGTLRLEEYGIVVAKNKAVKSGKKGFSTFNDD